MTGEFVREARYVVLKSANVMQCLTVSELIELRRIQAKVEEHRAEIGKPPLDCVVVESDWPEYEPTWKAIEARVNGVQQVPDGSAVQTAARIMNVDLIRQRDAAELMSLALRAKIAEMERQEPIAWTTKLALHYGANALGFDACAGNLWGEKGVPLYALPGAQNVPEKLCYDSRWEISIDYVDGWNAAIDAVRGKSPSWYCPDCCIVFPFGEPKSCPHDDARCNRALTAAPEVKP